MAQYTDRFKTRTVFKRMTLSRGLLALPLYVVSLIFVRIGFAASDVADSLIGTEHQRYIDKD